MNYSEMSDVEIALAVGKLTSFDGLSCIGSSGKAHIHDWDYGLCTGWKEFDPCNSWADAGPIIHENKISLIYDGDDSIEPPAEWILARHVSDSGEVTSYYGQPNKRLRSAMIVFLMMQEQK